MPKPSRLGVLPAVVALLLATALAACGTSEPSSPVPTAPVTPPPSVAASGEVPGSSSPPASEPAATPIPSELPLVTEPPSESAAPTASSTPDASESPTAAPGAADACTVSNDANREFFVRVADAVEWPVLCAVLPTRWLLVNGTYHLARGGAMAVDYRGPGGATLNLQEGAFCGDPGGCVTGTDAGDAAFGPLVGTLVVLDDGGFAIVVDRGASPSWLMTVHGVDQATAASIGAAMVKVGG